MASPSIDEYRRTSYEISQEIAPGWDRWRSRMETAMTPVREWLIGALAAPPGATVLELAAAAGETGFQAVGAGGHLISTDFSPAMLDVGRRRAAELGLENVEFRVMDAERIELDTDSVDGVLCRFGYMLMADPAAALAETRRVLRPGGRLALAVWATPLRNPFVTIIVEALAEAGHVPPLGDSVPKPFSMASPDHTTAMLAAAGFTAVTVDEVAIEFRFHDLDDYLGFMVDTTGPIAVALRRLSEQDRHAVAAIVEGALDGVYTVSGAALVAAAG